MLTDKQIIERLRQTELDFCAVDDMHHRLDVELRALLRLHTLTPQEAQRKTQVQKEKLDAKDRMAAFIRAYRDTHAATPAS